MLANETNLAKYLNKLRKDVPKEPKDHNDYIKDILENVDGIITCNKSIHFTLMRGKASKEMPFSHANRKGEVVER
jgi:hypothetical protein